MKSKHWMIRAGEPLENHPFILEAAEAIKKGEAVAFPTETVYGLGANAFSDEAVNRIFTAKGRPSDNPLIIHIYDQLQMEELVAEIPDLARQLFNAFAPGPLTLVLKSNGRISRLATAGLESVGIRIPNHPVAIALLKSCGLPLAAPSANVSGKPSPTQAAHVLEDLDGRIAGVLDGGETGVGVESTVLDLTVSPPMILRPGGISREQIEEVIGKTAVDPALEQKAIHAPRSPGMKYTHYAPKAPLWLVEERSIEEMRARLLSEAINLREKGERVGIITTAEGEKIYRDHDDAKNPFVIKRCGHRENMNSVARELYHVLRSFDHTEVSIILSEAFPYSGIGAAIMNRLNKAAGGRRL